MGSLTRFLQDGFERACPRGWRCAMEAPVLSSDAARWLGYAPRADVVLERADRSRRVWVEFEVSRADPVANHAKFATSRFFDPGAPDDAFVSMSSRHIVPGRAALAAGTAMMMRAFGIAAFQVDLLPMLDAERIRRLNAMRPDVLQGSVAVDFRAEIDRALAVADALVVDGWHRIHKADNAFTVAVNVREWNGALRGPQAASWGRRRVRFFVFDPASGCFAPSKFCAFIPAPRPTPESRPFRTVQEPPGGMTLGFYAMLGEQDPRFDGHVARKHLEQRLGYRVVPLAAAEPSVRDAFDAWRAGIEPRFVAIARDAAILLPARP